MNKMLIVAIAFSIFESSSSRPAASQDCCYRDVAKGEHPADAAPVGGIQMPSVSTEQARQEFNASSNQVRIVALLSPTCPGCQSGHATVGRVLKKFPFPKLKAIVVWEPMKEGDSPAAAAEQAETVRDARIYQGWNANKDIGQLFSKTLDLNEVAWDVYLLYKPRIRWEGREPPRPTFWMHQLEGADPSLLLCENPNRLSAEVGKLLAEPN